MANLIACNLNSYRQYRDGAFEHLARIGLTNVEIPCPEPEERGAVQRELDRFGLRPSSLIIRCEMHADDAVRRFAHALNTVAEMGVGLVFTSIKTGGIDRDFVYGRLQDIGDAAAERGIVVAMETHPDLVTNADVALETMRCVDHPNIRVNFDTANVHYYNEGVDSVDQFRKIAHAAAAVHLKDTNGGYQTWHFPALGEGIVDFPSIFEIFAGHGRNGPYTLEVEGDQRRVADAAGRGTKDRAVAGLPSRPRAGGRMILAVDIGGTRFRLALGTSDGRILKRKTGATDRSGGARWMIDRILEEGRRLLASSPEAVSACGVSFGGPVDFEAQQIVNSTHVSGWDNVAIPDTIHRSLGVPAIVDNDANAGALGELTFGAGKGCRHLVYYNIGTGIGAGIIIDREIYRGANGNAGELGHVPVLPDGPLCDCGNRGCLEALCSGTAIGRRGEEAVRTQPRRGRGIRQASDGPITAKAVFDAARTGDGLALELVK